MGRTAKPWFVLNAWKAIHALESNQVATNLSTIVNCDSLLSHSIAEIKQELISAIKDELIDEFDDGLLKINHTIVSSSHDWYCFVCFNPGERMIGCQSCFRLYHKTCFRYSEEEGKCYYCQVHPQEKIRGKLLDISTINDTLEILFHNLVANFQSLMDIASLKDESPVILKLLSKLLHNPHFDFLSLQNKINEQQYKSIADFIVDFKLIYFNVAILNGPGSIVVEKFDEMFKYILSQEKIITSCIQCYYNLYCKVDGEENFDWFLVPCNPPHRLCFAKIEEFCHPVKVIKSNINESFVWLFDENHEFITVNNESLIDSLPKEEIITPELSKALEAYEHLLSMGNESKERDFDNDNGEDFSEKCFCDSFGVEKCKHCFSENEYNLLTIPNLNNPLPKKIVKKRKGLNCEFCGKFITTVYNMKKHYIRMHPDVIKDVHLVPSLEKIRREKLDSEKRKQWLSEIENDLVNR